jgi:hypothetical protein
VRQDATERAPRPKGIPAQVEKCRKAPVLFAMRSTGK